MENILRPLSITVLCLAPVIIAVFFLTHQWRARRKLSKSPFSELRRRPPGEALRLRLEGFNEEINEVIFYLIGFPIFFALIDTYLRRPGILLPFCGFVCCILWTVYFSRRLHFLLRNRANYQLGFDGERFVGEELNGLMVEGFQIYHDLPFDGFNVDHVLVGPAGVFAIETKSRRKPINGKGATEYRVEFNGDSLRWPWGTETRDVEQAANNARTVAQWLTGAVGESVGVGAILTLPGWMIERKARAARIEVLNPKEINEACASRPRLLNEQLIQRIVYQLNQKCRLELA